MMVIRNQIAESGLKVIDLTDYRPRMPVVEFDLKPFLLQGYVFSEKFFRVEINHLNWNAYGGKVVHVFCSNDAVIPYWAPAYIAAQLEPVGGEITLKPPAQATEDRWVSNLARMPLREFVDQRVMLLANVRVPPVVFARATVQLLPLVQSLLCGEPGFTIPIYSRKVPTTSPL